MSYHYPSYKQFFSQVHGKTALAFWEKYPSPRHLKDVTVDELALFLKVQSNYNLSTTKAEQIINLVREDGDTSCDFQENRDFIVQSIVRSFRFNLDELEKIESEISGLMKGLGYQLETMTGIEVVTAAELVAEIGDIHRFPTPDKLARFAGIAPIFAGSGGKGRNHKSKQGNRVLHEIIKNLAVRQVAVTKGKKEPRNPYFYNYYEKKMAGGKTKQQALVCIMRKQVKRPVQPPDRIQGRQRNHDLHVLPGRPACHQTANRSRNRHHPLRVPERPSD